MQDLGRNGDVDDLELIEFIVDGLGDQPSAAEAMLYLATSIQNFKYIFVV